MYKLEMKNHYAYLHQYQQQYHQVQEAKVHLELRLNDQLNVQLIQQSPRTPDLNGLEWRPSDVYDQF